MNEVTTHCYCCVCDTEAHMLQCQKCKRLFHPGCLKSDRPSYLVGDIFFKFTCMTCSEDGEEFIERMKLQWIHVVVLALYNLQLRGGGKCGFFRWREHICSFIDQNWNTFFKGVRKKTTTWHGTVAGTLSQGCPQFFRSGTDILGESGWWALNSNKLPTLQELEPRPPVQKSSRRSKVSPPESTPPMVGGLRLRRKTSIIQAAVELKEKKLVVQERKSLRKSRSSLRAGTDIAIKDPPSSDEIDEEMSPPLKATHFSEASCSRVVSSPNLSDSELDIVHVNSEDTSESVQIKSEDVDVDVSSCSDFPEGSNVAHSFTSQQSVDQSLVNKWLKMEVEVENDELDDIDVDFEDTANLDSPNSTHVDDLLSVIPEGMPKEETDVELTDVEEGVLGDVGSTSDIKEDHSEDSEEDTKDSISNSQSTQVSAVPEVGRKRKAITREITVKKEEESSGPKFMLMSSYDEQLLLKKLEKISEAVERNPVARRLRRKLIVRQLKRDANLPLFNIDAEIQTHLDNVLSNEINRNLSSESEQVSTNRMDYRILDRYQLANTSVHGRSCHHTSFVTRLMGFEDIQKDSLISPYTTRILQPLIFKDYESTPLKLKLLQEIVSYHHRKDPNWVAPQRDPIVYCYVRPHHIPIVNALCQEFFWPGIDLSECLEYPDFSCISLYKKVIIGFAFMVPDVKYNEAYISFIFTHPEWRRAGIATFMLYHLIQTCMGKDVTLHVSATNPALLLYQKFGFKIEEFILDFYEKYHPANSQECRHAMFLRLSR